MRYSIFYQLTSRKRSVGVVILYAGVVILYVGVVFLRAGVVII